MCCRAGWLLLPWQLHGAWGGRWEGQAPAANNGVPAAGQCDASAIGQRRYAAALVSHQPLHSPSRTFTQDRWEGEHGAPPACSKDISLSLFKLQCFLIGVLSDSDRTHLTNPPCTPPHPASHTAARVVGVTLPVEQQLLQPASWPM